MSPLYPRTPARAAEASCASSAPATALSSTTLGSGDREGHQDSTVSVFTREADRTLRHFYSAHPRMAPDIQQRGIDLLAPIWQFMDLTPQGRGDWYANLDYGTKVQARQNDAA
jgi:predicted dithiol-disulfide oxidoreductase (DUF899 family)